MTEGHWPCRCDRCSDTLTGQLRLFPQDYSARPLLHPFYCAAQSFQLAVRRPCGPDLWFTDQFTRITKKLLSQPPHHSRPHRRTPAIAAHPLSGSSCGSKDKVAVLIIHRRSSGDRAVRKQEAPQALNFTPSSNNTVMIQFSVASLASWFVRVRQCADTRVCKLSGNIRVKTCERDLFSPPPLHPPQGATSWERLLAGQRTDDLLRAGPAVVTRCLGKEGVEKN